jgi:8-hydroxy-5-deazaflavin:NADPH oxidoreductase
MSATGKDNTVTRIGILGSGHIGANVARFLAAAGHDVVVSFSTDADKLAALAADIGARATTPAMAAAHGDVVVLSVPWGMVDTAIAQAGGPRVLAGKIVIDTCNQFARIDGQFGVLDLGDQSAAEINAAKAPAAQWTKTFNTLTAGFQASAAGRAGADRVVLFHAAADDAAADVVASLIADAGFDPVRTGTLARTEVGHQEPKGDLYGEEFHHAAAVAAVARLRGTPPSGKGRP